MRNVLFKKWIPIEYEDSNVGYKKQKKGTGCFEADFTNEGVFHQWSSNYEEFDSGVVEYGVALVEMPDGTIEQILPRNIKFIDPIKP